MMHLGETDEEAVLERVREIETALDQIFTEAAAGAESPVHGARRVAERVLVRGRRAAPAA